MDYDSTAYQRFPRKVRKLGKLTVAEKIGMAHEVIIKKAMHSDVAFEYQVNVWSVSSLIERVRKNPKYIGQLIALDETKEQNFEQVNQTV